LNLGATVKVLFVSSEIYPLAKTGGLADVSAALPKVLATLGVDIRLVLPGYPTALRVAAEQRPETKLDNLPDAALTQVISARLPDSGLPVWLVDSPALFRREGGLYHDLDGRDWGDNAQRFAHLTRVAARIAVGEVIPRWRADVVHCNDWHAGLLPLQLSDGGGSRPATLFTIHNLAFQGLFPERTLASLRLPNDLFTPDGIEFHGQISFLKAGIRYSDRLTTVSPSYAREILTPEFGCGLNGLLRARASELNGIANGIDDQLWNPAADPHVPTGFSVDSMTGKSRCKEELQRELGLASAPRVPLLVWVSRITHQKMVDTVLEVLPALLDREIQLALIGQGDADAERALVGHAIANRTKMAVRIGYDEGLAHRYYAAGDLLLHPSRFEPCGLAPLYAMRYGAVPIVRRVGGLLDNVVAATEDTIRNGTATGFTFQDANGSALLDCVDRALAAYAQPPVWRRIQQQALTHDSSWMASAQQYLSLYRVLTPSLTPDALRHPCAEIEPPRCRPRPRS
jgi:starch synthase